MTGYSKDHIHRSIGQRIRQRRIELGLPQKAIARALGVKWQQAQKYERGAVSLSAAHIYSLASCLRVPIDDLFAEPMADSAPMPSETGRTAAYLNRPPSERECLEFFKAFRRIKLATLRSTITNLARAVAI